MALLLLSGKIVKLREAEVMDIDEDAFRRGQVTAKLYGYLNVPHERKLMQSLKSGSGPEEQVVLKSIALNIVDKMEDDFLYIIGPGTTTRSIMDVWD